MAKIQIEESEHTRLTETAGRVTALESERDTAVKENGELKSELATLKEADAVRTRKDQAADIVAAESKAAEIALTKLEIRGLVTDLPVKEGALDVEAFTKTVQESLTEAASDTGRPKGFGSTVTESGGGHSVEDFDAEFGKEA